MVLFILRYRIFKLYYKCYCPECSLKASVVYDLSSNKGLAHFINISSNEGDWTSTFDTSQNINDKIGDKRGRKGYDVIS